MLGGMEIIIILCVVLLLFGGKRLPEFARNLGQGLSRDPRRDQGGDTEG
jgi:sec-independent protein translocase protein TatA